MAAFPKYHELICNTYTPDFTAGPASCVLQTGVEKRSRRVAGGSFFRSVEVGSTNNGIEIECIVTPDVGNSENVEFKYTDQNGNPQTPITFAQEYDAIGTPPSCLLNGINQLRAALAGNSILTMPTIDTQQPWNSTLDDAECKLTSFGPFNLLGASGPPVPSSAIRTGPSYTLYHIGGSEDGVSDGTIAASNYIIEWDGNAWVSHPSTLYEIGDPVTCP